MVKLTIPLSYTQACEQINRMLLMMKITIALLLVGAMHLSATTLSQTITLNVKDATIKQVFDEIHQQTKFGVIYNDQHVDARKKVTIVANQMPLELFLQQVLASHQMTYKIKEKTIFVQSASLSRADKSASGKTSRLTAGATETVPVHDGQQTFSVTG